MGAHHFENPLIWIPLAFVQGFTIFNFTILLHEVLHHNVFERPRPLATRILGLLYATPSGISASQFTRWHLDHHAELGSDEDDPKRHHLSPKVNARWFKLLYATPALFPIYFRAARRETIDLSGRAAADDRASSARCRSPRTCWRSPLLWYFFGFYAALRTSIIPVFFIFPIAFTLNRLGQHYDIDPNDPAKWGTLMKGHWFWDFAYLNSNYHLEHHYFPGVPFYRLPALQRALMPFFERKQMRWMTYGRLVYGWIVENHAPHTDWSRPSSERPSRSALHAAHALTAHDESTTSDNCYQSTLSDAEVVDLCRKHTLFEWSAQGASIPSRWPAPRASTSGLLTASAISISTAS